MSEINHSAAMRAKIESGLKHLDALEGAGFQVVGYHLGGDLPTFTVVPMPVLQQPKDYAEDNSHEA
jgi:hypothetical protein